MHGCASVAGMANLIISLKKQAGMIVSSILEAHMLAQPKLEFAEPLEVAGFAANLVKFSLCVMMSSQALGDCKCQALTALLGHKCTWVASFGVAAAIACWAHVPSVTPEDVILHCMSPWHDKPYEMWHMCRHFQHHCSKDIEAGFPEIVMQKLQSICRVLETQGVWQDSSMLWNLIPEHCFLAESAVLTLQVVMPVKVLMRSAVSLAVEWVQLAGKQILCSRRCHRGKAGRCSEEDCSVVVHFMLDMLDAILIKSLHLLINSSLQSICSLAIFGAIKAASKKDLMLVPTELVHLHVCLDAVWHVSAPQTAYHQHGVVVGSEGYRRLKGVFNEVMLVNESKVRQWIHETAEAGVPRPMATVTY